MDKPEWERIGEEGRRGQGKGRDEEKKGIEIVMKAGK